MRETHSVDQEGSICVQPGQRALTSISRGETLWRQKQGRVSLLRVWRVPTPSPGHRARTQQAAGKAQACFSLFFWGQLRMCPSQLPLNVNQFVEYNSNHPATLLSCVGDAMLEKSCLQLNCIQLFVLFCFFVFCYHRGRRLKMGF